MFRKDVVLRVIAAGLNPETCSVVRVMTPHPDTATPHTTIMDALRRMHGKRSQNTVSAIDVCYNRKC